MALDPNLLKRCNDLRRLAERAGTPAEAQAAAKALAKIMAQHRLDEATVASHGEEEFVVDHRAVYESKRLCRWRHALFTAIGDFIGVATVRSKRIYRHRGERSALIMCGTPEDCERVRYMFQWLSADIISLGRAFGGRSRASWRLGFVAGITERLEAARQEVAAEADSTALAVCDSRAARAMTVFEAQSEVPVTHTTLRGTNVDSENFLAGYVRGTHHPLGGPLPQC